MIVINYLCSYILEIHLVFYCSTRPGKQWNLMFEMMLNNYSWVATINVHVRRNNLSKLGLQADKHTAKLMLDLLHIISFDAVNSMEKLKEQEGLLIFTGA
jgi:hypothetical protein